ncbi:MAG: DUF479 domain-containing protein [Chitinophagaceae bacterium]|jgi:acyl carrier protein phosphodiesterase|nr:MAG: DUF479 domain-containing protein [Chitinophagaceae bacterium]
MNYLAHAFLSFGNPDILAGNIMADFVKGKKIYDFSHEVQSGIRLHRAIDEFTDNHEATRQAKKLMYAACGRYSGAFADIIYDHFLALDKQYFDPVTLEQFAQKTYRTLQQYKSEFPEHFENMFFYMKMNDWLAGYYLKENIDRAFHGIYRRAKFLEESEAAFSQFESNYDALRDCYAAFMPDIKKFAANHLSHLSKEFL